MTVWGVRTGASVEVMADALGALKRERRLLGLGVVAQVVWQDQRGNWHLLERSDPLRPDPAPPAGPRDVPWYDRRARGGSWLGWLGSRWGRKAPWFGRRGDKSARG